jgi:8-hydroxy-5-deazaflavin:NADPH oxidoreductase
VPGLERADELRPLLPVGSDLLLDRLAGEPGERDAPLGGALLGPLDELVVSLDQDLAHRGIVSGVSDDAGRSSPPAVRRADAAARRPSDLAQYPGRGVLEPVAIIGATGALGFGLAVRWGTAGVPVVLGSRDPARAAEAADRARAAVAGATFTGAGNEDAAQAAPVVVLAVPFRNQSETLTNLKGALGEGQILVDATVPLAAAVSGKATRTLGVWQGSAAQQAQEMVPDGVRVVSALHTVSAPVLSDLGHRLDEDVLVCGDRRADKEAVMALVSRIDGLRPVDAGRLEMARITEQLTALLISINVRNKVHAGIKITGL